MKDATAGASQIDPESVRALLQHVPLTVNQTVIVARGPQVIASRGALKQVDAADVAVYVAHGWNAAGQTERLQFMHGPLLTEARLLLTFPLANGFLLTLVDAENASLSQLRNLSNQLLSVLEVAGLGRQPL